MAATALPTAKLNDKVKVVERMAATETSPPTVVVALATTPADDEERFSYLTPPSPDLACPICHDTLSRPVELAGCQHVFCKPCIEKWLQVTPRCPCDQQPVEKNTDLLPVNKIVHALLDALPVRCNSCNVISGRGVMEHHHCAKQHALHTTTTSTTTKPAAWTVVLRSQCARSPAPEQQNSNV